MRSVTQTHVLGENTEGRSSRLLRLVWPEETEQSQLLVHAMVGSDGIRQDDVVNCASRVQCVRRRTDESPWCVYGRTCDSAYARVAESNRPFIKTSKEGVVGLPSLDPVPPTVARTRAASGEGEGAFTVVTTRSNRRARSFQRPFPASGRERTSDPDLGPVVSGHFYGASTMRRGLRSFELPFNACVEAAKPYRSTM